MLGCLVEVKRELQKTVVDGEVGGMTGARQCSSMLELGGGGPARGGWEVVRLIVCSLQS
jgi:hypothetical protein